MGTKNGRKQRTAEFKATAALAAIKSEHTAGDLASMYRVPPTQVGVWKKQAQEILRRSAFLVGGSRSIDAQTAGTR